jgi:predicted nucleotide-binding protein
MVTRKGIPSGRKASSKAQANRTEDSAQRRARINQSDVPTFPLEEAVRVPQAILENYAGRPVRPVQLAHALNMNINSGHFRMLTGSALAYGLISGGGQSSEIAIEPIGRRIIHPTAENDDDLQARREALMRPRVIGQFLRQYDGANIPREDIAMNVLTDMGVPRERSRDVLNMIVSSAEAVGFILEIKGRRHVDLQGVRPIVTSPDLNESDSSINEEPTGTESKVGYEAPDTIASVVVQSQSDDAKHRELTRRVFITHGHSKAFIDPIKRLLGFGEMQAVVSVERQTVSQPVPDKVMNDMRSCGAAIIHVDIEQTLIDKDAKEQVVLNHNVLIEIGAAMALYGRRFILLVREGVNLPSNLQGLFEVRYSGETLDGDATIRLLEAINDIKNHPLPSRYADS